MNEPGNPPALNAARKHAVLVSASLVTHRETILVPAFRSALEEAFEPHQIVELILQSLLFDGYPCALEGLIVMKKILPPNNDISEAFEAYSSDNLEDWTRRGLTLCRSIYGDNFEPLLRNVQSLSPTLREWMLVEGYGRVLARPALPIDVREMGIVGMLIVKGYPRQLHSHMRGAMRVGVTLDELDEAIILCRDFTIPENIEIARGVWRKLS
jgi:4-carboxymuconolactone decarboxylase